ncbi:MAG: CsgG/HfaB family protein [Gemmatimonadetes bacterium]|nr:CsgG/HfaB family protein [Gemmatimonadota bacterium]
MFKPIARVTALLALAAAPALAQDDMRPTLAVLPFVNSAIGAANAELQPLSKGIAELLLTELAQNPGIRLVERENILKILEEQNLGRDGRVDDATAARIGKLLGAKHMMTGSFITDRSGKMVVTVKSIDTETGRIEWTHRGDGKTEEFLDLVSRVGAAANAGLKLPAIPAAARQTGEVRTEQQRRVPFQAVMLYSRAISAQDAGNRAQAIDLFSQAITAFPNFADAKAAKAKLEGGQ